MLPLLTIAFPMPSLVNKALLTAALTQNFSRKGTKLPAFIAFIAFMAFIACRHGQRMMYSAQKGFDNRANAAAAGAAAAAADNMALPASDQNFLQLRGVSRHVNAFFWCLRQTHALKQSQILEWAFIAFMAFIALPRLQARNGHRINRNGVLSLILMPYASTDVDATSKTDQLLRPCEKIAGVDMQMPP